MVATNLSTNKIKHSGEYADDVRCARGLALFGGPVRFLNSDYLCSLDFDGLAKCDDGTGIDCKMID